MSFTSILTSIVLFFNSAFTLNSYSEGIVGQVNTINPLAVLNDSERSINYLVFRSLFKYNKDGILENDLAKSYDILNEGLTYSVILKDNIKWHDGSEITSDDIIFTASQNKNLREISTDKIDDKTVHFHLPNKYAPFLSVLTIPLAPNGTVISDTFFTKGSGDFKVIKVARNKQGVSRIELFTNSSNYNIKKIVFRTYENEEDVEIAYKVGQIDGFLGVNKLDWPGLEIVKVPIFGRYYVLHLNTLKDVFKSQDDRNYALKAINYEALFDSLNFPYSKADGVISNSKFTKGEEAYFDYDPSQKFKDNEVIIEFYSVDSPVAKRTSEFIKKEWERVGIKANISYFTQSELIAKISTAKDYDVLLIGEEVGRDPDRYVFWHSTQIDPPGLNFSNFSNLRVDKSLELGRDELNEDVRKGHYDILQSVMAEEKPALYLFHPGFYYHLSEKFNTPDMSDLFYPYERFARLNEWDFNKGE